MSLNQGFELDDEDGFVAQVTTETAVSDGDDTMPFEFSGEMNDMAAAQSNAQDLTYLRDDIASAAGMNKSFALEADRLIPGFISPNRPIGYFTELPTKTQFSFALESVKEAIENATSRIWEVICKMVEKFIAFLKDVIQGYKERKGEEDKRLIDAIVKNHGAVHNALQKVARLVEKPEHVATLVLEKLSARSDKADNQEKLRRRLIDTLKHLKKVDETNAETWSKSEKSALWLRFFFAGQKPRVDFGHAIAAGEGLFEEINRARHRLTDHGNDEVESGNKDGRLAQQFRTEFDDSYRQRERQLLSGMTVEEASSSIRQFSHPISVSDYYGKSVGVIKALSGQSMLSQDLKSYEHLVNGLEVVLRSLKENQTTSKKLAWHAEYGAVMQAMQSRVREIMSFTQLYIGMSMAYRQLAKTVKTSLDRGEVLRSILRTSGFYESEIEQVKDLLGLNEITQVAKLLDVA